MKAGIEDGLIVSFDGRSIACSNGGVVLEGGTIVHAGKSYSGSLDRKIDATKRPVTHGLMNIHSHFGSNHSNKSYRGDRSALRPTTQICSARG